jgi:TonB family protein
MKLLFSFLLLTANLICQYDTLKSYYPNGNIESLIPIRKNIREGTAKYFYDNGSLKEERIYKNGKVEGFVKLYYENGNLRETFNIENGKRQGPTSLFDSNGVYLADKMFEDGKLVIEQQQTDYQEETVIDTSITSNFQPEIKIVEQIEVDSSFYTAADIMPEPVEGWKHFEDILYYPEAAIQQKIEGTVLVKALIDENGSVLKSEVIKPLGYGCEHAADIMIFYAKFKPGIRKGKKVKIEMIIPVQFKLPVQN